MASAPAEQFPAQPLNGNSKPDLNGRHHLAPHLNGHGGGGGGGGGEESIDDTSPSPPSSAPRAPLFDEPEDENQANPETESNGGDDEPRVTSPSVSSPPYWLHRHHSAVSPTRMTTTNGHSSSSAAAGGPQGPHAYNASVDSLLPAGAITLQDNEREDDGPGSGDVFGRDRNRACWAKSVEVADFVTVNGSATNIGAFVVWNIRVQTLNGSYMNIRKRYSEFDDFRKQLIETFPNFEAAVPTLPPKSVIAKFRPRFLEKRRVGLQYFLNCILLNPEFSGSPVLKGFLFS